MRKRAELVDRTRQRIIEAAVHLHTTIGPARTTVSALAEQAGVTRVTVYKHFPDIDVLFAECRAHWVESHSPPDVQAWEGEPELDRRARSALSELYGWYAKHAADLYPIYRDMDAMPLPTQEQMHAEDEAMAALLLAGARLDGAVAARARATARLVVGFWTWRSLTDAGADVETAADLAARYLSAARA